MLETIRSWTTLPADDYEGWYPPRIKVAEKAVELYEAMQDCPPTRVFPGHRSINFVWTNADAYVSVGLTDEWEDYHEGEVVIFAISAPKKKDISAAAPYIMDMLDIKDVRELVTWGVWDKPG